MGWFFNKKKKKQQDEFFRLLGDALKTANENVLTVGKTIYDRQAPDKSDFGRCESNPIFTTGLAGTEDYLSRLCTKDGRKFTWSRCASIRATVRGNTDIGEDVYTLYLNGEKYTDIYVVPYVGESKFPPADLYFCDDDTDWDLEREAFKKGVTSAHLIAIRKIQEESERERQRAQRELEEAIAKKSVHISEKYADFSIEEELKNPDFVFLANFDIDAMTVYEYCHRDSLLFKKVSNETYDNEDLNADLYFNMLYDIENREWQQCNKKSNEELQIEAASMGVRFEDFLMVRKVQEENAELKWKWRVKELRTIAKQAIEVQRNYFNFDLSVEWKNSTFREITKKLGMLTAFEVIHFNECYFQAKTEEPTPQPVNEEPVKLFCRKCGAELLADSIFCHRCGTEAIK